MQPEHLRCYGQASQLASAGRTAEALQWYDKAIRLKPDFAEAHNNRGLLLAALSRHGEALLAFDAAIAAKPDYARALNNRGLSQLAMGDAFAALDSFAEAIQLQPDYFPALANRADALLQAGEGEGALAAFAQVRALKPDAWQLHLGWARSLLLLERAQEARPGFERALALLDGLPDTSNVAIAKAEALRQLGRESESVSVLESFVEAAGGTPARVSLGAALLRAGAANRSLAVLAKALESDPGSPEALAAHAAALETLGERVQALAQYRRALAAKPRSVEWLCRKGQLELELGDPESALESFSSALPLRSSIHADAALGAASALLALRRHGEALATIEAFRGAAPDNVAALNLQSAILLDSGDYQAALDVAERILRIEPASRAAQLKRGHAAFFLGRFDVARDSFRRVLDAQVAAGASRDEQSLLHSKLMDCQLASCDWTGIDELRESILEALREGLDANPYVAMTLADDPVLQLQVATRFSERQHPAAREVTYRRSGRRNDRLRVAYLSADFHDHATAYLAAGLFEQHDRQRIEVIAVSFGPDDPSSRWRERIRCASEHFLEVSRVTDAEVAARLAALDIDIAVDLKGYTLGSRPGIFARRPAPVQVNYLGYPGSMGAPYIDYIVADDVVIPPGSEGFYSEKIIRLPGSFQVNDDARRIDPGVPGRRELGLPEDAVVLCSFNATYKLSPELFASWMRILQRAPAAVLWLFRRDAVVEANLRREALAHGVDPDRLVFAGALPLEKHLARLRVADLFLDSLPVNAHTTASDALWAGLPVLTQAGRGFAARVCASLLQAMQLQDLIVDSLQAYEDKAVALASDRAALKVLRARTEAARERSPLFDTRRFCRNLESAWEAISNRHRAGLSPDHITVRDAET